MSYDLLGFKWGGSEAGTASGEITWSASFFDELDHSAAYNDGQFDAALQAAFDRWESVASIDFVEVASGGALTFGTDSFPGTIAGQATYSIAPRAGLDSVVSGFVEFDISNRMWAPYGDIAGGSDFFAVALHEIGHILGLDHPMPEDRTEIMNATVYEDDLGDGDIAGIQFLYGTDLDDEDAPVGPMSTDPTLASEDDGGGGGGAIALLVGILAALMGLVFGGAGAAVAIAGRLPEDGEGADEGAPDAVTLIEPADWLPSIPVVEDAIAAWEDDTEDELALF